MRTWAWALCSLMLVACSEDEAPAGGGANASTSTATGTTTGTPGGGGTSAVGGAGGAAGSNESRFPLSHAAGERYLREATGTPFFFHGDTGWSLIAQLTREDAEIYLEDRRQKGFTVVLVNLLEHAFSDQAPNNIYGDAPFSTPGDYATPNEAYFAHADWVIDTALAKGLLVLLAPSYLGYGGGNEGFYQEMVANGATKLEAYGRFLGSRYRSRPNILWLHAGDYDPPNPDLVNAIVAGIRTEDDVHLHSAHTARGETASSVWGQEPWLDVDNVYTDAETHAPSVALHQTQGKPFYLIEGYYEGAHSMTEEALRYQAYGALLGGAMGQIFGNNPIWCFGASTCLPSTASPPTWQAQLDGRGSQDMAVLADVLSPLPWEKLLPDADLLSQDSTGAIAASAADGSLALVYTRTLGSLQLDLGPFSGVVTGARVDPTDGSESPLPGSPFPSIGSQTITLAEVNATGTDDWLLRLTAP